MDKRTKVAVITFLVSVIGFSVLCVTYLLEGKPPVVEGVKLYSEQVNKLPFPISRWLDVLIGSLFFTILVVMFFDSRDKESRLISLGAVVGFLVGFTTDLILIQNSNLLVTVFKGLLIDFVIFLLLILLIYGLFEKETKNFKDGLICGIVFGSISAIGFIISFTLIFLASAFVALIIGLGLFLLTAFVNS